MIVKIHSGQTARLPVRPIAISLTDGQCDQMAILFVHFGPLATVKTDPFA